MLLSVDVRGIRPYKGFANRSLSMAGFANPFSFTLRWQVCFTIVD